jgi:hypothetical protein
MRIPERVSKWEEVTVSINLRGGNTLIRMNVKYFNGQAWRISTVAEQFAPPVKLKFKLG